MPSPPAGYGASDRSLEVVRWVVELLDRRYREGSRLSEVACAAGVSRSHLCRIFKRVTGLSMKRFLTYRRLQAAKTLLREEGLSIRQVAFMVGYHDPSHFHRIFRRWEGQAPSLYRRQAARPRGRPGHSLLAPADRRSSGLPRE